MKSYCTISDIRFLPYGLSLYKSLKKNSPEFRLYYLCTDKESLEKLQYLELPEIIPVSLEDLKKDDPILENAANLVPSYEAVNVGRRTAEDPKKIQFFWCLTPYFTWHTLNRDDVEEVLYIDSDIYFFDRLESIFEEIGEKSIGIVRHRIRYSAAVGEYNVGIVYFRKTLKGYQCVDWWKNCLLDPSNQYYKTHGVCGDQKYLELFKPLYSDVCVIDKTVGHLAPWNYLNHSYKDEQIVWEERQQNLVYIHFSNFAPNYENGTYEMAPRHGIHNENVHPYVRHKYDEYFDMVRGMKEVIS